jgi:hypothetical protein
MTEAIQLGLFGCQLVRRRLDVPLDVGWAVARHILADGRQPRFDVPKVLARRLDPLLSFGYGIHGNLLK